MGCVARGSGVVLAMSRAACLTRILRRWLTSWGQTRPDMAPGCPERFELDFLRFVWDWHGRHPDYGAEITSVPR